MGSGSPDAHDRLDAFAFVPQLTTHGRARLDREIREVRVRSGEAVLSEGVSCQTVVLLEAGEIRVYKTSETGREISLYHVRPGEACILSVCSALSDRPYPAAATALASLRGLAVPVSLFRSLFTAEPALQRFVADLFSQRFVEIMALVSEVAFEHVDRRLARFLLARVANAGAAIEQTHAAIAAELGTVREVVTRTLESFASKGWVSIHRGAVTVRDPRALGKLLDDRLGRRS